MIDLFFALFVTFYFQIGLIRYTRFETSSVALASELLAENRKDETYLEQVGQLKSNFRGMSKDLNMVMLLSWINLAFPLNVLAEYILTSKTNRRSNEFGVDFFNELILFALTIMAQRDIQSRFRDPSYNSDNPFLAGEFALTSDELMASNIVWNHVNHRAYFAWVLAILSINTWVKVIIRMQMTERFGPMFKVIGAMAGDLVLFYSLWAVILLSLTSVTNLIFMRMPEYQDFWAAVYMHFEYALGGFDSKIYCRGTDNTYEIALGGFIAMDEFDDEAEAMTDFVGRLLAPKSAGKDRGGGGGDSLSNHDVLTCIEGRIFMLIFNSANLVLLLNLIIAILSSTYAYFEDKKIGLYYEVLVGKFAKMEFDDRYGAAACAQPPMNLMIAPFQWLLIVPCLSDRFLRAYNQFLCLLLYLPLSLFFTVIFCVLNVILVPWAYVRCVYGLLRKATAALEPEPAKCGHSAVTREEGHLWISLLQFTIFGPIILSLSIPVDCYVYYYNLYSKPEEPQYALETDLTLESLHAFCTCLDSALTSKRIKRIGNEVNMIELNKLMRKKLGVVKLIYQMLFEDQSEDSWVRNEDTGLLKLRSEGMQQIKIFNELKLIVKKCTNKDGYVNTELLRSFVHSVTLRLRMLKTAEHHNDGNSGRNTKQVIDDTIYEFSKVEPNAVRAVLAEGSDVLE
jgi:hypothetical protein